MIQTEHFLDCQKNVKMISSFGYETFVYEIKNCLLLGQSFNTDSSPPPAPLFLRALCIYSSKETNA